MDRYRKIGREFFFRQRTWSCLLMGFAVLLSLVYILYATNEVVDHDEVEHTHVAFKMLNGEIPYRDFFQNHLPAYWFLDMQFVRAFPFSINAILAARIFNLLALAACWFFGLRLLGAIRGGRSWFGLSIYTCAMITLACGTYFHEVRPDPLMTLIGTMGLCLIPLRGNISGTRALVLGILFGLSTSVSPKVLPMVMIVPALIIFHCIRDRRFHSVPALLVYGLGVLLGLLPTVLWIVHNGLLDAFLFDVVRLNAAISKSWYRSFFIFRLPICIVSVLGAVALVWSYRRRLNRFANGPLVLLLAMIAGFGLAFMARHTGRYNLQILVVPVAAGAAGLVLHLCLRRPLGHKLLLFAALLGFPMFNIADSLAGLEARDEDVKQDEMQLIMDLARPGNRTCTAFAPTHPVFCEDVSGLSNAWDLNLPKQLNDPRQLERFRKLWRDGIRDTLNYRPDIILRKSRRDIWRRAEDDGLITPEELSALDALRSYYEIRYIGRNEIWVRQSSEYPQRLPE